MRAPAGKAIGGVDGIVFDLDGTLVDAFLGIATAANAAREHFALPALPRAEITARVGRGVEELIAAVVGLERVEEGVRIFRRVYGEVCESGSRPLPGARETLLALRRLGIRAGVASNKPSVFSERILTRVTLRPLLLSVVGPDTAGALKPDPAMIHACLREIGVTHDRALYVGDMPIDLESGDRAGLRTVLIPGGAASIDDLRATGARVIPDLLELVAIVEPEAPQKEERP